MRECTSLNSIFVLLYTLGLVGAERCGDEAYFSPTGRCEPCGKLCDRPARYPDSCRRLCPNYVAKDRSTTTPIPSKSSLQYFVTPEHCGNDAYFAPTGRCEPCGKICDRPVEYPDSCQRLCPNYVAKDRPISTTGTTFPQRNSTPWIIGGFVGLGVLIIVSLFGVQIWKKLSKPYLARLTAQRASKNLRLPTQEQNNNIKNDATAPLNENTFDSFDETFDFGETFPFHSLTSLKSVF